MDGMGLGWLDGWLSWVEGSSVLIILFLHPYLKFCGLRDLLLNYYCCFIPPLYVEAGFMCLPSSLVTIYFRGLT